MSELRHAIRLRNGTVIYLPSSIPIALLPFVDTEHLIKDKALTNFKKLLKARNV